MATRAGSRAASTTLLEFVRANGAPLDADELEASDLILPPSDTTLTEAADDFSGEGWIPE